MKKATAAAPDPDLPFPPRKPPARLAPERFSPEAVARGAVARRPTTPSGRVKYTLTLFLARELAEALTVRAIREGKNVPGLVGEILEAEMGRKRA